ncbi:hypothetical protein SAMN02990966_03957 [Rhodospirillales bacterium URHD0017]|nr:hypothetical protein SAMN02990966_03957 [Rhodospirillales bacterium URHD0017]
MFKPLKHPNVKILEGVQQLVGQTGVIVDKEDKHYRVKLNQPVEVPGVGLVTSDLWLPSALKVIRPAKVASDAPAMPAREQTQLADAEHVLEEVAAVAPVEAPAPQPAPAADTAEAGTPATPAANVRKTKARPTKPKALSAKQEAQKPAA